MKTYYLCGFPITDEIYHHGIEGQKWGVRRFQNEDGTLTEAGKERYYPSRRSEFSTRVKSAATKVKKETKNVAKLYGQHVINTIKKNHPWLMDDEELARVYNRMSMEQKIRNIRKDEKASRMVNKVMDKSGDILVSSIKDFNKNFAQTAGRGIAEYFFGGGKGKGDGKKKDKQNQNNNQKDNNQNQNNNQNNNQNQKQKDNNTKNNTSGTTQIMYQFNYNTQKPKKDKKKA